MNTEDLLARVLEQNDKLIDALVAQSPVEVLRALNPRPLYVQPERDPYGADVAPQRVVEDPWGDPDVAPHEVIQGWTDPPFVVPQDAMKDVEEDAPDSGT